MFGKDRITVKRASNLEGFYFDIYPH